MQHPATPKSDVDATFLSGSACRAHPTPWIAVQDASLPCPGCTSTRYLNNVSNHSGCYPDTVRLLIAQWRKRRLAIEDSAGVTWAFDVWEFLRTVEARP